MVVEKIKFSLVLWSTCSQSASCTKFLCKRRYHPQSSHPLLYGNSCFNRWHTRSTRRNEYSNRTDMLQMVKRIGLRRVCVCDPATSTTFQKTRYRIHFHASSPQTCLCSFSTLSSPSGWFEILFSSKTTYIDGRLVKSSVWNWQPSLILLEWLPL